MPRKYDRVVMSIEKEDLLRYFRKQSSLTPSLGLSIRVVSAALYPKQRSSGAKYLIHQLMRTGYLNRAKNSKLYGEPGRTGFVYYLTEKGKEEAQRLNDLYAGIVPEKVSENATK